MDQRVVMKMIVAALQNRDIPINGSGEQLRTFCWVEDVVDGLVRLMEAPPAETTRTANFGSSHEVTIRSLADEPSGNLDSHNRDEIHRLFFDLRERLGQTVVIVTHDEHLAAMADRKITMSDGRIL